MKSWKFSVIFRDCLKYKSHKGEKERDLTIITRGISILCTSTLSFLSRRYSFEVGKKAGKKSCVGG